MSNDIIADAFKEANIQLRNMEVASEGNTFSVGYARAYADYLAYMIKTATKMHGKCIEALVKDATITLASAGYEVKPSSLPASPNDINPAIALLVKNGYKVTDSQGRNY